METDSRGCLTPEGLEALRQLDGSALTEAIEDLYFRLCLAALKQEKTQADSESLISQATLLIELTEDGVDSQCRSGNLGSYYNLRGRCLQDIGRDAEALDDFRVAARNNPSNLHITESLIGQYLKIGGPCTRRSGDQRNLTPAACQ